MVPGAFFTWLQGRDWQSVEALGTWAAGIALALFAWWALKVSKQQTRLSQQQFEAMHDPELLIHPRIWQPEVGELQKSTSNGTLRFNGIAWDLRFFNPGQRIIAIRSVTANLINRDTKQTVPVGGRPSLDEVLEGQRTSNEFPPELHVMTYDESFSRVLGTVTWPVYVYPTLSEQRPLNFSVWCYEECAPAEQFQRKVGTALKRDIELHSTETSRNFLMEVRVMYECLGAHSERPKFATIISHWVKIGPDVQFTPPILEI